MATLRTLDWESLSRFPRLLVCSRRLAAPACTTGETGGRGSVFKAHSTGHPLNVGELKVLEGTHGTSRMGLLGGEVG